MDITAKLIRKINQATVYKINMKTIKLYHELVESQLKNVKKKQFHNKRKAEELSSINVIKISMIIIVRTIKEC